MPEGPEIHRAADQLDAALAGQRLTELYFAFEHLKPWEARLRGRVVLGVEARGKAILTRFDDGHTLYSHNQLYGRWLISADGSRPRTSRQLRVTLHTDRVAAFLYSASDIELLDPAGLAAHRYLSRLGPELLDPALDAAAVAARLGEARFRRRALMGLLQDQGVLAGMGNYLCCEALHVAGLHPGQRPADLDANQMARLARTCLELTRQSYRTGGITNDLQRAARLEREGADFEARRFHVYRRAGLPCYRCGTPIVKGRFVGRMGYLCPGCQPAASTAAPTATTATKAGNT
ncbi:endonuclease VIII [Thiohalobacter sp. IOR34]|uniref:endonuclease VIII n=1 Tax=Thiohalobacter sp. IOR34 TaxID=3057176 RepID=UPI0025B1ECF3|nr:endonuclease VIII [Thiohalobacter sp. IOR34]WJW75313.1 endonuclease VIII [Thiohalobacter sp. IOR34]